LQNIDPENRLLARAPRYRFGAETIRDNALAASGLLVKTIGGPSVKPYQPPGLWKEKAMREHCATGSFYRDTGDNLYRRGMYTFWKQASPPPQMESFDAPTREVCIVRRSRTNTPLQALVLQNDETYLEAARSLAERLMHDVEGDWEESLPARLEKAFRSLTGRRPDPEDLTALQDLSRTNYVVFSENRSDAESFLQYGETSIDETLDKTELAALAFSVSAILNLDETITRD
jgi:hypothetical protein